MQTKSFVHKHPNGGAISGQAWPNGLGIEIADTRKFNGKRRAVKGVAANRGSLGWEVVHNPGENPTIFAPVQTETAQDAWELSLQ